MKKLLSAFFALVCVSCLFSSCQRNCGGSWYNNRNVQITPQDVLNETMANSQVSDYYFKNEIN